MHILVPRILPCACNRNERRSISHRPCNIQRPSTRLLHQLQPDQQDHSSKSGWELDNHSRSDQRIHRHRRAESDGLARFRSKLHSLSHLNYQWIRNLYTVMQWQRRHLHRNSHRCHNRCRTPLNNSHLHNTRLYDHSGSSKCFGQRGLRRNFNNHCN